MRIYKPQIWKEQGVSRSGRPRTLSNYYVELRPEPNKVVRFVGHKDKVETTKLGAKLQLLVDDKKASRAHSPEIEKWLRQIPQQLKDKLVKTNLITETEAQSGKPLLDYLPQFAKTIRSRKQATKNQHATNVISTVKKIIDDCKLTTWDDADGDKIDEYIESLQQQGMEQQTAHIYVQRFNKFCRWMVSEGYAYKAPKITAIGTIKNFGIPFQLDEFEKLLETTKGQPTRFGLSGYQRFLVYLLACETGLRRGELISLTPASFDFKNNSVFVKREDTKSAKECTQLFTAHTGQLLQQYVANKMPNITLFNLPQRTAAMIRADCKAAQIKVVKDSGKKLNFHSLRHTTGSFLQAQGVSPKELQEIMRHSDINLTMSRYTHLLTGQKRKAVDKFPAFGKAKKQDKTA